ncbi:MAG: TetR/AcrR family transcriptional regulator [Desulfobacterales bacterium]|nr:TetR/AcrR family transcriptional regulator [Desulfobacterales bacterium]
MTPQKTKERILSSATDVFAEFGYGGARMDMIARRAGVNKAGIYYHIGGKETLYETVLKTTFGNMFDAIVRAVEEQTTPTDKLRAYVKGFLQDMTAYPYLPPIMMREIATGGKHISKSLVTEFSKILNCLSEILKAGEAAGIFVKATPVVVHFMIISTNAYLLTINSSRNTGQTEFSRAFESELAGTDTSCEILGLVMRSVMKPSGEVEHE